MPVPRIESKPHVINDASKARKIVRCVRRMGYYVDDIRAVIDIIEKANIDKSQFDFPYGSFEEFKKHAFAGEFDVDESKLYITDEERARIERGVEEGRLWMTY